MQRQRYACALRKWLRAASINLARRELDPRGVFESIAGGREISGLRMPAWRRVLSDEEIWQATAYVLSISQQAK